MPQKDRSLREEITKRYPTCESAKDLAHELGVSVHTVFCYASALGLQRKKLGERKEGEFSHKHEDRDYIILCFHAEGKKRYTRIREHRYVMEQHLGRKLKKEERVHHKNGDKKDNRLKNLILFKNEREHALWHLEHPEVGDHNAHRVRRVIVDGKLWCPGCKRNLPIEEYTKDEHTLIGFSGYCKECKRKRVRAYLKRKKAPFVF